MKKSLESTNFVTLEFIEKVDEVSRKLEIEFDDMMAVMAFESWFNPAKKNMAGGFATGLIQFMPSVAEELGTSTEELSKMSGVEQMDYVYLYYEKYAGKMNNISDVYMVTLWPKAVGKSEDYVLFSQGSKSYNANAGLDINNDGKITKSEASAVVLERRNEFR